MNWIRRNTAMNSIKTIIVAATLSTLSLGAAQAAETIKPVQAASFHDGTQHAVAYFLTHNAGCKLVLTLADDVRYAPVRFEAAIADGSSKHYPFAGKSLEFACQNQGQAMTINTREAVATNR
jgi:hypothetical protein